MPSNNSPSDVVEEKPLAEKPRSVTYAVDVVTAQWVLIHPDIANPSLAQWRLLPRDQWNGEKVLQLYESDLKRLTKPVDFSAAIPAPTAEEYTKALWRRGLVERVPRSSLQPAKLANIVHKIAPSGSVLLNAISENGD